MALKFRAGGHNIQLMSLLNVAREINEASSEKRDLDRLLHTIENIYHIKDLDFLLERALYEARRFVKADAGTIYIIEGERLCFSCVQNDTLIKDEKPQDKYLYSREKMELNTRSLAGYVAITGESLLVDDVYDVKSSVSYSFNPYYDKKTSYTTRSILIVPVVTRNDVIVGVLQLINAKNEQGEVVPFSNRDKQYMTLFSQDAANAIEKAQFAREMVLRMVKMSGLMDPFETAQHAVRLGAYSVELYEKWAERHDVPKIAVDNTRDQLRTAAMLHDIGKVAVSNSILNKSEKLDYHEKFQMKYHTIQGARLFDSRGSTWDKMAFEVALNHHERWDGGGYPGKIDDIHAKKVYFGPGKKEKEIPLAARIVALADVYDALVSKKAYKPAWKDAHALKYIKIESGKQFDPELAGIFLGLDDVLRAIRQKYTD